MAYPTLEKLFYADSSSSRFTAHEQRHRERFDQESSFKTGIELNTGELFLAVPRELSLATEQVLRRERRVSVLWRALPPIALGAYIRSLIMSEVVYSNEIEGVYSTRRQIEAALEQARAEEISHSKEAKTHHSPFVEFAKLYLGLTENPLPPESLQDIRDIYDSVVKDSLDEENKFDNSLFRTGPVVIENERGKIVHTGVSPESGIERMLDQWLALSKSDEIPEIYGALLCHFLFGYIHPFYDGNGRTGRYLLALHLSAPLSQPTVLSLSRTIAENKAAYYKAFDITERQLNCAEGTHFVLTMLDLIEQAQEQLIADLESKQAALGKLNRRVDALEERLGQRACSILFYAAQMHLYGAFQEMVLGDLATYLKVSKPTTRKALDRLCEQGLAAKKGARPPVYQLTDKGVELLGIG